MSEITDHDLIYAVYELLCDYGFWLDADGGPPGLEPNAIPGRVADVIAEVERLRAHVAELEAAGISLFPLVVRDPRGFASLTQTTRIP